MKKVFTLAIVGVSCLSLMAQDVKITLRDSSHVESKIKALSQDQLFTQAGNYPYKNIAVLKYSNGSIDQKYINIMLSYKVAIYNGDQMLSTVSPVFNQASTTDILIIENLVKFEKQRTTGKALQLIGMVVTAASIAIQIQDPDKSNVAFPIVGGGLSLVGFVIDLDASKHLKFKR